MFKKLFLSLTLISLTACGTVQMNSNNMVVPSIKGDAKIQVFNIKTKTSEKKAINITQEDIEFLKGKIKSIEITQDSKEMDVSYRLKTYETNAIGFKSALEDSLKKVEWLDPVNGIYKISAKFLGFRRTGLDKISSFVVYTIKDTQGKEIDVLPIGTSVGKEQNIDGIDIELPPKSVVELSLTSNIRLFMIGLLDAMKTKK